MSININKTPKNQPMLFLLLILMLMKPISLTANNIGIKQILPRSQLTLTNNAITSESQLPYEELYQDMPLYLHALVNYAFPSYWNLDWEKNNFKRNGYIISVGSVTSQDLLVNTRLTLNHDLTRGWWFISRGVWYDTKHQNKQELTIFFGLERQLIGNFNIFMLLHPRFNKEFFDMQIGLSLYGDERENYLNIALVLEDPIYNDKNDRNGEDVTHAKGVQWYLRYGLGKWTFYSDGYYGSGFKRIFPDSLLSPFETLHQQKRDNANLKFYYQLNQASLLQLGFYYYSFSEARNYYQTQINYDYQNTFYDFYLEYTYIYQDRHRIRALTHYITQDARSIGFRGHDYTRNDIMPMLSYQYLWSEDSIELGYMFTVSSWQYNSTTGTDRYRLNQGYYDKIYIGYTHHFDQESKIYLSLSHEVNVGGFGGGNLRYMMFF